MTKREILLLASPAAVFGILGVFLWMTGSMLTKQGGSTYSQDDEQRFEAFVRKAQTGEAPLTPEVMAEGMRRSRAVARASLQVCASNGELLHTLVWCCVLGVALQVYEVCKLARRGAKD